MEVAIGGTRSARGARTAHPKPNGGNEMGTKSKTETTETFRDGDLVIVNTYGESTSGCAGEIVLLVNAPHLASGSLEEAPAATHAVLALENEDNHVIVPIGDLVYDEGEDTHPAEVARWAADADGEGGA